MDKWKKTLSEDVSDQFEGKVLNSVRPLLRENEELFAKEAKASSFRWQLFALPGLAVAVLVVLTTLRLSTKTEPVPVAQLAPLSQEMEIALDFAMYKDLQEIENLELLQKLGDPDTWPQKGKRAPKS